MDILIAFAKTFAAMYCAFNTGFIIYLAAWYVKLVYEEKNTLTKCKRIVIKIIQRLCPLIALGGTVWLAILWI